MESRICAQCETVEFTPKNKLHVYCSRECQLDFRAGRDKALSKSRQETGFSWEPVRRAVEITVKAPANKTEQKAPEGWHTAVILPDPQIGYRYLNDGTLDPFHDDAAIDIAMQILAVERPNLAIWLGDFLDFAPFGRFRQEPGFAQTVQPSIERGHEVLALTAALADETRLIEGNHDARLENYITDNALAAAGLRRAKSTPDDWPVLSVPYLLRMDDLDIEYVGGYPSGATYLNDALAAIHGHVVKSGGSTAAEISKREHVSVLFGHIHRQETHYQTRNARGRSVTVMAHSPGTLARVDGAVPSVHSAVTMRTGKPATHFEDWQQGVTVVRFDPEGQDSSSFVIEPVRITNGQAVHRGVLYTADTES